jgi:ankyrin repeat protein
MMDFEERRMPGLNDFFNKLSGRQKKADQSDSPLYKAVKEGNVEKVKRLLQQGADPNICDAHHLTPLHQAAYWGEKEIVELLLKHGARVDPDNGKGWTALHSAAVSGGLKNRKEIIGLLIGRGADPDKADKHGWTPKDYMLLWEVNAEAAERLKKYLAQVDGMKPSSTQPKKPTNIRVPKH